MSGSATLQIGIIDLKFNTMAEKIAKLESAVKNYEELVTLLRSRIINIENNRIELIRMFKERVNDHQKKIKSLENNISNLQNLLQNKDKELKDLQSIIDAKNKVIEEKESLVSNFKIQQLKLDSVEKKKKSFEENDHSNDLPNCENGKNKSKLMYVDKSNLLSGLEIEKKKSISKKQKSTIFDHPVFHSDKKKVNIKIKKKNSAAKSSLHPSLVEFDIRKKLKAENFPDFRDSSVSPEKKRKLYNSSDDGGDVINLESE